MSKVTSSYWIWSDVPPPRENTSSWVKMFVDLKVDGVCISTRTGRNKNAPVYLSDVDPLYLARCSKGLQAAGIKVSWMTHPVPGNTELKEHERDLEFLYNVAIGEGVDVSSITPQFDLETWWFDADQSDAKQLVSITNRSEYVSELAVNFVPKLRGRPDVSVERVLAYPQVKTAILQFYQFYGPPGHWSRRDEYRFGGSFERACYACAEYLVEKVNPDTRIVMAQALYAQQHPGDITGTDALDHWLRSTRNLGYTHHCAWSLKHTREDCVRPENRSWAKELTKWFSGRRLELMQETGVAVNYHAVQSALKSIGHYLGNIDGIWGPKSTAAHISFCKENNLPLSGTPTDVSLSYLLLDLQNLPK